MVKKNYMNSFEHSCLCKLVLMKKFRKTATKSMKNYKNSRSRSIAQGKGAEEIALGEWIVVTIKRLGINGEGIGYFRRKAVFIDGAITGEVVKAQVTQIAPTYLKAEIKHIEQRVKERITPLCPHYGECGGCQLQHVRYDGQLVMKRALLLEALQRYCGMSAAETEQLVAPMLGMPDPWHYRNKAQLRLAQHGDEIAIGLYALNSQRIVDISDCPVQHTAVNAAVRAARAALDELAMPIPDGNARGGAIVALVVRFGFVSRELQMTFIVQGMRGVPKQNKFVNLLRSKLPNLVSIALNYKTEADDNPLVFGSETEILWGEERMHERLGALELNLSPRSFMQLNPVQTVKLYDLVQETLHLTGTEHVVDAYCGSGTIALWLAPYAATVRGIEAVPEAVLDAERNATLAHATNCTFHQGEAERVLRQWHKMRTPMDVIIADPPRQGLKREFVQTLISLTRVRSFVYVSCNPATFAKDASFLRKGGYRIASIKPVDMFPQTSQVECVAHFVRDKSGHE
jgi:23S rRNA (uracil1939-C5)-methyltransferase